MLKSKLLRTVSLIMVTVGLLVLGSTTAFAQSKTVTGKVVDANGPVIGAFVMDKGLTPELQLTLTVSTASQCQGQKLCLSILQLATSRLSSLLGRTR